MIYRGTLFIADSLVVTIYTVVIIISTTFLYTLFNI